MGLVDRLEREFDLEAEWLGFEIHPDTPPGGVPLVRMFPRADPDAMARRLNEMAEPFGLEFRKIERISNSRLSLEASEFAKEQGRFRQFHRAVFKAYFSLGRDIGDIDVLAGIGKEAGLEADALAKALQQGTYRARLDATREEAGRLLVTAAPTFLIAGSDRIVGAQPLDVFRNVLGKAAGRAG